MKRSCWGELKQAGCESDVSSVDSRHRNSINSNNNNNSNSTSNSNSNNDMCSFLWGDSNVSDGDHISSSAFNTRPQSVASSYSNDINNTNNDPNSKSPQAILAQEMNQLSLQDRTAIYEEIHGVNATMEENEELVGRYLARLDRILKKLPNNEAYVKALFLSPRYVKSIRILFLRADLVMDPKKAARRMLFHFQKKKELFGMDCLGRSILWDDLSEDAISSLQAGYFHYFPSSHDRTGRQLGFSICSHIWDGDTLAKCHTQACWYSVMTCLEQRNDAAQRKGFSTILYFPGSSVQHFYAFLKTYSQGSWVYTALPYRVSVVHLCLEYDESGFRQVLSSMLQGSTKDLKIRTRLHYGSHMEVQYALGSFGIGDNVMPVDQDGNLKMDLLQQRLEELKRRAEQIKTEESVLLEQQNLVYVARDVDVLLGRGQPYQRHPGTVAMMEMVQELRAEHDKCGLHGKKLIAKRIVERVKQNGGRFLQKKDDDDDVWKVVTDQKAHEKVAMGFRNLARK